MRRLAEQPDISHVSSPFCSQHVEKNFLIHACLAPLLIGHAIVVIRKRVYKQQVTGLIEIRLYVVYLPLAGKEHDN